MTGLTPEQRYRNHKVGHKASKWVRRYGIGLLPALYKHLNPLDRERALIAEVGSATALRATGLPFIKAEPTRVDVNKDVVPGLEPFQSWDNRPWGEPWIDNSKVITTAGEISEIGLARSMCYGMCPVYDLTLTRSGDARFDGQYFVSLMGLHTASRSPRSSPTSLGRSSSWSSSRSSRGTSSRSLTCRHSPCGSVSPRNVWWSAAAALVAPPRSAFWRN